MSNSLKAKDYSYAHSDVVHILLKVSKALKRIAALPHVIPSKMGVLHFHEDSPQKQKFREVDCLFS